MSSQKPVDAFVVAKLGIPKLYLSRLLTGPVQWSERPAALIYDGSGAQCALRFLRTTPVQVEPWP